jgi:hypothetical protein
MDTPIQIRIPTRKERKQAYTFIDSMYKEYKYCDYVPQDELDIPMLVALKDSEIVGTIGLAWAASGPLPIEHYFGFETKDVCPYFRSEIVEICKLVSYRQAGSGFCVLKGLVAAICQYSYFAPMLQTAFMSQKPVLVKLMQRYFKMPLYALEYPVVEENVKDYNKGYFLCDPRPVALKLYANELSTFLPNLSQELEDKVEIDLTGFDHQKVNGCDP